MTGTLKELKAEMHTASFQLGAISDLAALLADQELEVARARARLNTAIREAAKTLPHAQIARAAGVSRQMIGKLVANG